MEVLTLNMMQEEFITFNTKAAFGQPLIFLKIYVIINYKEKKRGKNYDVYLLVKKC